MKRINIISLLAAGVIVISTGSCKKFIQGYEIDPNNPISVTPDLVLPTAEVATDYVYGGDYGRYSDMWTQHQSGNDRQFSAIATYTITESDVDNVWRFNAYGGGMYDLYTLINGTDPAYAGVAKILMAANLGLLTDGFGDIPYTDAFKGSDEIKPTYDSQESIYNSILSLLSSAHSDLDAVSDRTPGGDDLFYGGDLTKWHAAANALLARYHLHLGARDASNYQAALDAIDAGGMTGNGDDLTLPYGDDVTNNNLWFQFYDQRSGYMSMGAFFIDLMTGLSDPRLPQFATDPGTGFVGSDPGEPFSSDLSLIGPYYGSPASPIPVMTYVEQKFIEAECAFRTGDMDRAASAYNEGVIASLDRFGVTDDAYIAANASATSGTVNLDDILTQKYIAMFTQFESWTDYRRTGIPTLDPASGGAVPVRFPYPQSERLYNSENLPGGITISTNLWWDVD